LRTRTKTNPVSDLSFQLRHCNDRSIHDKDGAFTGTANKAITFIKNDMRTLIVHPTVETYFDEDDTNPWVPATERGAVTNLYFDEMNLTPPNNNLSAWGVVGDDDERVHLTFEPWVLSGTSIDTVNLRIVYNFNTGAGWHDNTEPSIRIYNYTDTAWEELHDCNQGELGYEFNYPNYGYENWLQYFDLNIDIVQHATDEGNVITDYFDIGATNNSNYAKHDFIIRVTTGDPEFDICAISFRYVELKLTFDADQTTVYGLGKISSDTATTIVVSTAGATKPNLTELPAEEGFGHGDDVFISDFVDISGAGIAQDIFTNSDTTLTLDFSATNSNKITEITDISFESIYSMLQKWADMLNAIWWVDYENGKVVFATPDNLVDSGVTLTEADAVDGDWLHDIDITNIANKVTAIGKNEINKSATPTPEYTLGGDDEEVIYRDVTINSQIAIQFMANSKELAHENASKEVRMTLDYSNPNQDYSPLEVGKLVTVQLLNAGDTSECNYSGSDKLVIIAMEFNRSKATGYRDLYTLTMQRRYS
jgi:hypothetical protein